MRHWRSRRGWIRSGRADELDRRATAHRRLYAAVALLVVCLATAWLFYR